MEHYTALQIRRYIRSLCKQRRKILDLNQSYKDPVECMAVINKIEKYLAAYRYDSVERAATFFINNHSDLQLLVPGNQTGKFSKYSAFCHLIQRFFQGKLHPLDFPFYLAGQDMVVELQSTDTYARVKLVNHPVHGFDAIVSNGKYNADTLRRMMQLLRPCTQADFKAKAAEASNKMLRVLAQQKFLQSSNDSVESLLKMMG